MIERNITAITWIVRWSNRLVHFRAARRSEVLKTPNNVREWRWPKDRSIHMSDCHEEASLPEALRARGCPSHLCTCCRGVPIAGKVAPFWMKAVPLAREGAGVFAATEGCLRQPSQGRHVCGYCCFNGLLLLFVLLLLLSTYIWSCHRLVAHAGELVCDRDRLWSWMPCSR